VERRVKKTINDFKKWKIEQEKDNDQLNNLLSTLSSLESDDSENATHFKIPTKAETSAAFRESIKVNRAL